MNSIIALNISILTIFFFTASNAGTIVFLNGTSCAGKTSIRKALLESLEGPTESVDIDQVALEMLQDMVKERGHTPNLTHDVFTLIAHCPENVLSKQDLIALYPAAQKKSYDLVRKHYLAGKNVVTETVVFGDYDTRVCLESLHDLAVMFCFVYCSPEILFKHLLARNQSGDKADRRSILMPFTLLLEICKKEDNLVRCIDMIDRTDMNAMFDAMAHSSYVDDQSGQMSIKVNDLRDLFLSKFGLHQQQKVGIAPLLEYDHIAKTNVLSSKECAQKIIAAARTSQQNAIEKNYKVIQNVTALPDERSSLEWCGLTIWQTGKGQLVDNK